MVSPRKTQSENPEFWLTVIEAADLLGIKRRRMLDFRDRIKHRRVDNPRSGKSFLMFERAAVEAFREQRELAKVTPVRPASGSAVPAVVSKGNYPTAMTPAVLRQAIAAPAAPQLALFLDLDQASTYTGLSTRLLRSMIVTGELPARRDGRAWKVRKTALREIAHQNPT